MASPKYTLDQSDLKRWAIRASQAIAAAVAAWIVAELIPGLQKDGTTLAVVLVTVFTIVADLLRRWATDTQVVDPEVYGKLYPKGGFPPPPKMLLAFLLASLTASGSLLAQGVDTYPEHSLVRLTEAQEADSLVWIVRRLPDGFRPDLVTLDNGKECIWTGPPGSYDIDVILIKAGVLSQNFRRAVIESKNPVPPPDPIVPPGPDPVVPPDPNTPDQFGYVKLISQLTQGMSATAKKLAPQFASNYQSVSAAIFAGGITNIDKAYDDLVKRNRALSNQPGYDEWKSVLAGVSEKVDEDFEKRRINTLDELATVFKEVATGLGKVK